MTDKDFNLQRKRVKKILHKWINQMGMKWFHFDIEYFRVYDETSRGCAAKAIYDRWMYRDFELHFFLPAIDDLKDDDDVERVIIHELTHCLTAPLACNMQGTDTNDKYRRDLIEQTTEIITAAFDWTYRAGKDSK